MFDKIKKAVPGNKEPEKNQNKSKTAKDLATEAGELASVLSMELEKKIWIEVHLN